MLLRCFMMLFTSGYICRPSPPAHSSHHTSPELQASLSSLALQRVKTPFVSKGVACAPCPMSLWFRWTYSMHDCMTYLFLIYQQTKHAVCVCVCPVQMCRLRNVSKLRNMFYQHIFGVILGHRLEALLCVSQGKSNGTKL